jgi:5'(3')-deoxyribonucleotidase
MSKKILYIDMDDTIADFTGSSVFDSGFDVAKMYEPGFFLNLKPIDGALVAVRALIRLGFDVQILSQPVAESAHSYLEKAQWINLYFPELILKVNLTQDKGLFKGHYLVDDNLPKWQAKFEANGGKFIHFPYTHKHDRTAYDNRKRWEMIVNFFKEESSDASEKEKDSEKEDNQDQEG